MSTRSSRGGGTVNLGEKTQRAIPFPERGFRVSAPLRDTPQVTAAPDGRNRHA